MAVSTTPAPLFNNNGAVAPGAAGSLGASTAVASQQAPLTTSQQAPLTTFQQQNGGAKAFQFGDSSGFDNAGHFINAKATSPVVTTSAPAQAAVDNTNNTINAAAKNPPAIFTSGNPNGAPTAPIAYDPNTDPSVQADINSTNKDITDRQTALSAERDQEISAIMQKEQQAEQELRQKQANETGSTTRNLLYLQQGGQSASAQSYLNSLEQTHGREMSTLQAQYNSSISQAKNAYADKDFQLADQMAKNARDIKKEAQTRNQDFLNYTLNLRKTANEESKQAFDQHQATQKSAIELQKSVNDAQKDAHEYATKNGITQPFYELAGQLFNSANGKPITNVQDFLSAGGKQDYSNVFVVKPNENKQYAGGDLGEFQYLVDQGKAQPGDFLNFLHTKANEREKVAKAGRTVSYNQNLGQEAQGALSGIITGWQQRNMLQGNGKISSTDYKRAKSEFVKSFAGIMSDAGKEFDSTMNVFVDTSNKGDKDKNGNSTNSYKDDYGIN